MKENNCQCAICHVEAALLDSLSTQTARTHFQALAKNYLVLNHFTSPVELITQLHEHGENTYNAGSEILHALIHAIGQSHFEEIGQHLLLLAFTPAIHKLCREITQQFPSLPLEDVAQQATLCLLEAARFPWIASQNGHLVLALVRTFRKDTFRWAIKEANIVTADWEDLAAHTPEPAVEDNVERNCAVNAFLQQCRSKGLLSDADYDLLVKFYCEGFEASELVNERVGLTPKAVHHRVETILGRLRRAARDLTPEANGEIVSNRDIQRPEKKFQRSAGISPGSCPFSNSEKEFSPELAHPIPQVETGVTQVAV